MDIFNAGTSFFFPHMMGVMEIEMMFYLKLLSFIKKKCTCHSIEQLLHALENCYQYVYFFLVLRLIYLLFFIAGTSLCCVQSSCQQQIKCFESSIITSISHESVVTEKSLSTAALITVQMCKSSVLQFILCKSFLFVINSPTITISKQLQK
jgi:hypothetical protein